MSIFKIFSGPSAEKLEKRGDALVAVGKWGQAKLEYEHALIKAEKAPDPAIEIKARLKKNIAATMEALAAEHLENADLLLEGANFDEARELVTIALGITTDPRLKSELEARLGQIEEGRSNQLQMEEPDPFYGLADDDDDMEEAEPGSEEEYFLALLNTLPQEVQEAYLSYGNDFQAGYIALNRGDFQSAVALLTLAMEANAGQESFIPLELATAHLHAGDPDAARSLLEPFLKARPDVLPAYQLLCEIYWEKTEFGPANALLDSVPAELKESLAVILLRGETRTRAGETEAAKAGYLDFFDTYGWNDHVARALAAVHEALGEKEKGRTLYKEMMGRCTGCGARIDPFVKHRYAELTFESGQTGTDLAELYLSLAREAPEQAALYFDRLSRIYGAQGNTMDAERFRSFAARAAKEQAMEGTS
ncbi:MAG: tetratricopeptide repeat protein [Desulfobacterales bacterium]|nr:tetratricopeptide repeat protein [Desulfobacterales bacterium]